MHQAQGRTTYSLSALAAAKRHAAATVRPFMPGLARELDAEGGAETR